MDVKFDWKSLETGFEADWPVTISVPQDGGTVQAVKLTARFRLLDEDDIKAAVASDDPWAVFKAYLVSAKGDGLPPLRNEKGEPLPFFDKFLRAAWVRDGLTSAYHEFGQGIAAKN